MWRKKPSTEFNVASFILVVGIFVIYSILENIYGLPGWLFVVLLVFVFIISSMLSMKNIEIEEIKSDLN